MGNASSHPHPPPAPLIALNGGSLGRGNTFHVPAEALAGKWSAPGLGGKKSAGFRGGMPVYTPVGYGPLEPGVWGAGRRMRRGRRRTGMGMGLRGGGGGMPMYVPMVYPYASEQHEEYVPVPVPVPVRMNTPPPTRVGMPRKGILKRTGIPTPMGGPGMQPQAGYPPTPYVQRPAQPRAPRPPQHAPNIDAVAQGVHFARPLAQPAPPRAAPVPKQAASDAWSPVDSAFLNECSCAAECKCRMGARVMWRQEGRTQGVPGVQQSLGEIRYVLRDEVGRGCSGESEGKKGKKSKTGKGMKGKKGKEKRLGVEDDEDEEEGEGEVDKMRAEMRSLRDDIRKMRLGSAGVSARIPGRGAWTMMNRAGQMDPRMGHYGVTYGADFPSRTRPGRRPRMSMPNPEDGFPYDDEPENMFDPSMYPNMPYPPPPPHLHPPGRRQKRRPPPGRPPRRAPAFDPDFDPEYEYPVPPGRRGVMPLPVPRQRGGGGPAGPGRHAPPHQPPPPPPPEFHPDFDPDFEDSGADSPGGFGPMHADEMWSVGGTSSPPMTGCNNA